MIRKANTSTNPRPGKESFLGLPEPSDLSRRARSR